MAGDIIKQIISHQNDIYGLSGNGNLYRQSINGWEFVSESPEYSSLKEKLLSEITKKALEEDYKKAPQKYYKLLKQNKNKT